jgi:peroxiredoxin
LKIGETAPDFWINDKEKLSDLRGYVVLLSFYPAAFSGIFPGRNASSDEISLATVNLRSLRVSDLQSMSCVMQITSLDKNGYFSSDRSPKKPRNEARRIAISSSTPALLTSWKGILGTSNIEYANDSDYSASVNYSAYNPLGYNNRVSVIVDRKGKVAYVDTDYSYEDAEVLNRKLEELLNKSNSSR